MNKIQAKNMLNDVVKHFGKNPEELRSVSGSGCHYVPPPSKPKSIGCAIGMYLSDKVAKKLDYNDLSNTDIKSIFNNDATKSLLPKWMQKMDINFLEDLQNLHDSNYCWSKKGLSEEGKTRVKEIKEKYNL